MRNVKNRFYRKLKVSKDTRKVIKFFNKIKPEMIAKLVKKQANKMKCKYCNGEVKNKVCKRCLMPQDVKEKNK